MKKYSTCRRHVSVTNSILRKSHIQIDTQTNSIRYRFLSNQAATNVVDNFYDYTHCGGYSMQKPINDHNYAVVNKIILSNGDGHMHTHTHRMPSVRPFTNKDIMHICMLRVIRRRTQASHRINVYMLSYRLKYFP